MMEVVVLMTAKNATMAGKGIPAGSVAGLPFASIVNSNLSVLSVEGPNYVLITYVRPPAEIVVGLHSVSMGHASKTARCVAGLPFASMVDSNLSVLSVEGPNHVLKTNVRPLT
jgi:hypothetical protein